MRNCNITITLTTGNEAFRTHDDLVHILRSLADRVERLGCFNVNNVLDRNGNTVGTFEVHSTGRPTCDECGRWMTIDTDGVSHHVDHDGAVDHDADADHVSYCSED